MVMGKCHLMVPPAPSTLPPDTGVLAGSLQQGLTRNTGSRLLVSAKAGTAPALITSSASESPNPARRKWTEVQTVPALSTPASSPFTRTHMDEFGEDPGEMTLIGEAATAGDLPDRQLGIQKQILGSLDSSAQEPPVGRHSG